MPVNRRVRTPSDVPDEGLEVHGGLKSQVLRGDERYESGGLDEEATFAPRAEAISRGATAEELDSAWSDVVCPAGSSRPIVKCLDQDQLLGAGLEENPGRRQRQMEARLGFVHRG